LLANGFAQREWLVLAEAAVQGPIGERRILVECCPAISARGVASVGGIAVIRLLGTAP